MIITIIALAALYLLFGLILFAGVWIELEKEDIDISDKPRLLRIAIRLSMIVLWPILFIVLCAWLIISAWICFWNSLTE